MARRDWSELVILVSPWYNKYAAILFNYCNIMVCSLYESLQAINIIYCLSQCKI